MKLSEEIINEMNEIDENRNMGYHEVWREEGTYESFKKILPKIQQLENLNEEMLNIIIKITKELYKHNPSDKGKAYMKEFIDIIEKVSNKKWEEICEN